MKKIIFRTDGNARIGAGHIMRCLSMGEAARVLGLECTYITADDSFESLITSKGFPCKVLDTLYSDMNAELSFVEEYLNQYQPDVIFVDSYYVTAYYLKMLKKYGKTVYMDDVFAFPYPVDVLINYNIYADRTEYETLYSENDEDLPKLLLGTRYVPLRKEFQTLKLHAPRKQVKQILISTGGADPKHMALKILNSFIHDQEIVDKYNLHFVLGSFEPDREELKKIAAQYPRILLHENIRCMSALMLESDLAVAAAGSTLYELAVCGVPAITYVLADNQRFGALGFERSGIMVNAGDCRTKTDFFSSLCREVKLLSENETKRKIMSQKGQERVNGKGAEQIIKDVIFETIE